MQFAAEVASQGAGLSTSIIERFLKGAVPVKGTADACCKLLQTAVCMSTRLFTLCAQGGKWHSLDLASHDAYSFYAHA